MYKIDENYFKNLENSASLKCFQCLKNVSYLKKDENYQRTPILRNQSNKKTE